MIDPLKKFRKCQKTNRKDANCKSLQNIIPITVVFKIYSFNLITYMATVKNNCFFSCFFSKKWFCILLIWKLIKVKSNRKWLDSIHLPRHTPFSWNHSPVLTETTLSDSRTNSHRTFDHHECWKCKSRHKIGEIIKFFL